MHHIRHRTIQMEIHITTTMVSITAAKKNEIAIPITTMACVTTATQAKIAQTGIPKTTETAITTTPQVQGPQLGTVHHNNPGQR